jgi:hypothetical protein
MFAWAPVAAAVTSMAVAMAERHVVRTVIIISPLLGE